MTTNNVTLSEAIAARTAKHNEAISLLSIIETAQTTIQQMQVKLNKLNTAVSYYKAVADVYATTIEEQVQIRNEAVVRYNRILWAMYSADLPIFSTTGIEEIAVTLYNPAITSKVAIG